MVLVVRERGRAASLAPEVTSPSCLPGDNVQHCKEDDKGPHGHKEPREHSRDHAHAEEDQEDVLDEHLGLEGQAHVHWGKGRGTVSASRDRQAQKIPGNV